SIGALWGVGHTLTLLLVGGGIILFQWAIPPRLGLFMEFSVGLMLILLGTVNLAGSLKPAGGTRGDHHHHDHGSVPVHSHAHAHGDYVHTHPHAHDPENHPHRADRTPVSWLDRHLGTLGLYQLARPLLVGVVHGLAGSAAIGLLVLT